MTKEEAQRIIERVSREELYLTFVGHFWYRARKRFPGMLMSDVYEALRCGEVVGDPEWSGTYGNHVIRFRSELSHFGSIQLVLGITEFSGAIGITLYRPD